MRIPTKKQFRFLGNLMLVIAVCFVMYAFQHPEGGFDGISYTVTWVLYSSYIAIMLINICKSLKSKKINFFAIFVRKSFFELRGR